MKICNVQNQEPITSDKTRIHVVNSTGQAPFVRRLDNAIHWRKLYPLDNAIRFAITYPLDSDLSIG